MNHSYINLSISTILLIASLFVLSTHMDLIKQKNHTLSMYTISDIYYGDPKTLEITSESGHYTKKCKSYIDMLNTLEGISAENTSMEHLKNHLDWLIETGYLTVSIYPTIDSQCKITDPIGEVILQYYGPDWAIDAEKDIELQLGTFYQKDTMNLPCGNHTLTWYGLYGQD